MHVPVEAVFEARASFLGPGAVAAEGVGYELDGGCGVCDENDVPVGFVGVEEGQDLRAHGFNVFGCEHGRRGAGVGVA